MAEGLDFKTDWNHAAGDYAKHRAGFPDWFFDRMEAAGLFRPGMRVLDLATGTGTLARGFARRGGIVTGLDIAPQMMAQAKALDAQAGVSVEYVQAKAEATGMPDATFDLISAGTCWFWFDGDLAAAEAKRVLKPGGHLMIAMLAWLPLKDNVVAATERLIEKHNPSWTLGNYEAGVVRYMRDLANGGFGIEVRSAMAARTDHLIEEGLARRQGQRTLFARDLLATLRRRELDETADKLAAAHGLTHQPLTEGEPVAGIYRQRITLASGRFAMIDDGMGFQLVPWRPALEQYLGHEVRGIATAQGIDWSLGRKRGLGL